MVSGPCPAAGADTPRLARPNFVLFLADDHGYLDSTVYGATDVRTPNMQRLAREGMTFTHAFVASPSCAPSRAAILTSLMPARNGAEANHSYPRDGVRGLATHLKELNYEVVAFGKVAHVMKAADSKKLTEVFGFDGLVPGQNLKNIEDFLAKRDPAKPLCLFVGTNDPHVPWPENSGYEPEKLKLPASQVDTPETRRQRAQYYTAVSRADERLGEVYALSRKHLKPEETLFLYTSDHGAQWPFGKWNLYDAGIRVPLLAVWPGVIKPQSQSKALISSVDYLPTLLDLAGGKPPKEVDGRSFAPILRGKAETHREEIFATHSGDGDMNVYPCRCVRTRDFKYILNLHPEYIHSSHIDRALDRDGLKYWRTWEAAAQTDAKAARVVERYRQRPREELYDMNADPHELRNLAADPAMAERLAQMRQQVKEWMKTQGDRETVFGKPRLLEKR
jgi:arylsulfatase A-like enzyme